MTSSPAAPSRADVRRRGRVYGYRTWRPEDNYRTVEFGYSGQTIRQMAVRDAEHDDCQPWKDIVADGPHILVDGIWTGAVAADGRFVSADLDAAEAAVIRGDWDLLRELVGALPQVSLSPGLVALCESAGPRPRYNITDGGLTNPEHIPKWTARRQRWARDDAAERPHWVAPEDRPAVPSRRRPVVLPPPSLAARARAAVARRLAVWWSRVWPWVAGWTAAAVAVSAAWLVWVDAATVPDAATIGPVAATGLVGWVASRRKPKRRSKARKTSRRKGGKR